MLRETLRQKIKIYAELTLNMVHVTREKIALIVITTKPTRRAKEKQRLKNKTVLNPKARVQARRNLDAVNEQALLRQERRESVSLLAKVKMHTRRQM